MRAISKEERLFWLFGHDALMNLVKCVQMVSGEIEKSEGGNRAAIMDDLHGRMSPIYRATRRLMRKSVPDALVDSDPELKRLRQQIDPEMNDGIEAPAPGNVARLDDPQNNASNTNLLAEKKPFSKAGDHWPYGPSRTNKRAVRRGVKLF